MNASDADLFKPAGLRISGDECIPCVVCQNEGRNETVFLLARPSRPMSPLRAGQEAAEDLDSTPGSGPDFIGPDCLRYLHRIGYRVMPEATLDKVELLENMQPADEIEDEFYNSFEDVFSTSMIEALYDCAEEQIRRLEPPEVRKTLVRLRRGGYSRDDAMEMIVHVMAHETTMTAEDRDPHINIPRYIAALDLLPELSCADREGQGPD